MPDIERIEFIETTAFKERKQTIDKVNEIIDKVNSIVNVVGNQCGLIPLELDDSNPMGYVKMENVKDGDIAVIYAKHKVNNSALTFVFTCLSSGSTVGGEYETIQTATFYRMAILKADNKYSFSVFSIAINPSGGTLTNTSVRNDFDYSGYIIRGVE